MTNPTAPHRPKIVVLSASGTPLPHNQSEIQLFGDVTVTDADGLSLAIQGAEILFLWDFFSAALKGAWRQADCLEWVHVAAAGVDAMLFDELRDSEVLVSNAKGIFDGPIAEYVLAQILAHDKQLYANHEFQRDHIWKHRETMRTSGRNALVIGTGGIGRACARLLKAVGLDVRGVGRTAQEGDADFGQILPSDDLDAHIGWADHIVLVAPLTAQTRGLIRSSTFAAMKSTAHVINVGRGGLVDENALTEALQTGAIAAASLDVVAVEPLPADSKLWSMPNVHLSAHMSGDILGWREALAEQFLASLKLWIAREPLPNLIDKEVGYARR